MNEGQLQAEKFLRNAILRCKWEGMTFRQVLQTIHWCGNNWFPEEVDEIERKIQATLPDN